jgi:hypothetical protein
MDAPSLPPFEYLLECSTVSLHDLEIACLERSQRSLKMVRLELEQSVAQRECAGVARWLIENRHTLLSFSAHTLDYTHTR